MQNTSYAERCRTSSQLITSIRRQHRLHPMLAKLFDVRLHFVSVQGATMFVRLQHHMLCGAVQGRTNMPTACALARVVLREVWVESERLPADLKCNVAMLLAVIVHRRLQPLPSNHAPRTALQGGMTSVYRGIARRSSACHYLIWPSRIDAQSVMTALKGWCEGLGRGPRRDRYVPNCVADNRDVHLLLAGQRHAAYNA